MKGSLTPRVKICCISSIEEAKMAIEAGASAIGLVGQMPSGPGVIEDVLINQIARIVPPGISSFLLTRETSAKEIIKHHLKVNTQCIQIVDELSAGSYEDIRDRLPSVKLVQVIHVIDESSIKKANEAAKHVDAILLDSGNPNLKVKVLGGTGRVHNWELSRTIREIINKPTYLAGGIRKENVREAIEFVQPFGLDLCNGVRTKGKLDKEKLREFFDAING